MIYKTLRDNILPSVIAQQEEKQRWKEAQAAQIEAEKKRQAKAKRDTENLITWNAPEIQALQAEADRGTRLALRQAKQRTKEIQELEEEYQLYDSKEESEFEVNEKSEDDDDQAYVLPERRRNSIKVDDWFFQCPCGIKEMNYDG